jgi:uncharacterized protein
MESDIASMTTYFAKMGKENTEVTMELARKRALELNIKTIIVASTGGETGVRAVKFFKGFKIVVVGHACGSRTPNVQEMSEKNISEIKAGGGYIVTAGHALAGIDRAIRRKFNTYEVSEIIANTLRTFSQGMKVAVEIAMMAADNGVARTDEEVVSIGGTGHGADTAVVLGPVNTQDFFDIAIKEIICKPRL